MFVEATGFLFDVGGGDIEGAQNFVCDAPAEAGLAGGYCAAAAAARFSVATMVRLPRAESAVMVLVSV